MTNKQLVGMCQTWQKRLRLQDWEISIEFTDAFNGTATYGECSTSPPFMQAAIKVRSDLKPKAVEETVVHELLHVRFPNHTPAFDRVFNRTGLVGNEFEIGIEMVARALVDAYE